MTTINSSFDLSKEDSFTFFGEQVSAFWDSDRNNKAIFKGEEKAMPYFKEGGLFLRNEVATFSLKETPILKGDFLIDFAINASSFEEAQVCEINGKGFIRIKNSEVYVDLGVDSKAFIITLPKKIDHNGGPLIFSLQKKGNSFFATIVNTGGEIKSSFDDEEKLFVNEDLKITALFGGMMDMNGSITHISFFDKVPGEESEEEVEEEVENEESEEEIEEINKPVETMNAFSKPTEKEAQILSSYAALAEALKGTRLGSEFDVNRIKGFVEKDDDYLIKLIYYALIEIDEYKDVAHNFLTKRANHLKDYFGRPASDYEGELPYKLKTDKVYKSHLFGEISNENLTLEILVILLKEEYEFWKDEIIKN